MFTVGQKIQLEWDRKKVISRIRGFRKGHYVLVDMDYGADDPAKLGGGQKVVARLTLEGAPCGFVTRLSQFLYQHGIAALDYPEIVERHIRPEHEWFPMSAPVEVMRTAQDNDLEEWRVTAREVCLGGLRAFSKRAVERGDTMFLTFTLPAGGKVDNAQATAASATKGKGGYEIEFSFVAPSDENAQALLNFTDMATTRSGFHP